MVCVVFVGFVEVSVGDGGASVSGGDGVMS